MSFGGLHLEEEEFVEVNEIDYSPCYEYINSDNTRYYLEKTSMRFNKSDQYSITDADLHHVDGTLRQYGGKGTTYTFSIVLRDNGVFVDWSNHYGDSKIEKVEDR